jgi:hypothetical protein
MFKFQTKLQELGMTENQFSAKIRNNISQLRDIVQHRETLEKEAKSNNLSQSDREDAQSELQDVIADITNYDDDLVHEITKYHKNKANYDNLANMARNRKNGRSKNTEPPPVITEPPPPVVTEIEKKSGIGTVIGIGIAVALGVLGIQWYKKNN